MKLKIATALIAAVLSSAASAAVTRYTLNPGVVTPPDFTFSARGVWFNVLTGVVDERFDPNFPSPLFENGKFMLKQNKGYSNVPAAAVPARPSAPGALAIMASSVSVRVPAFPLPVVRQSGTPSPRSSSMTITPLPS